MLAPTEKPSASPAGNWGTATCATGTPALVIVRAGCGAVTACACDVRVGPRGSSSGPDGAGVAGPGGAGGGFTTTDTVLGTAADADGATPTTSPPANPATAQTDTSRV